MADGATVAGPGTMRDLNRRRNMRTMRSAALALAVLLGSGCDDSTGPGVEPEIRNDPDNFEFQVSSLSNYSATLTYDWSNSGTAASVDHSASISDGAATLIIEDDAGELVYTNDLAEDGTFFTDVGQSGDWRIRVVFDRTDGTINFRVQTLP